MEMPLETWRLGRRIGKCYNDSVKITKRKPAFRKIRVAAEIPVGNVLLGNFHISFHVP
jgi:hypothetical protein